MTELELNEIEKKLRIKLPNEYRQFISARAAELRTPGCFDDDFSSLYLSSEEIIRTNTLERPKEAGTGYAFPEWWEVFFLIGTNGGGDYYCLRLDNEPGVWMIGSDCGDEPTRIAPNLGAYIDKRLEQHRARVAQEKARDDVLQDESAEELQAIGEPGDPRARAWLESATPDPLFRFLDNLGHKLSPRRLRLFGIACCRRLKTLTQDKDCVQALAVAEQMTEGTASADEISRLRTHLKNNYLAICNHQQSSAAGLWCVGAVKNLLQDDNDYLRDAPIYAGDAHLLNVWNSAFSASSGSLSEAQAQADLLREVVGNPFLPLQFDSRWRTVKVIQLARMIYHCQAFDHMGSLADELKKAGCENQRVLKHCQRKGGHVRGCWVLDLILQTEPDAVDQEFAWDFHWEHPKINSDSLKRRLQAFGTDTAGTGKVDGRAALAFAEWLEQNGEPVWSRYVRVRCALDGKAPTEHYPDLFEKWLEIGAAMKPGKAAFEGLYFSGYRFASDEWWEVETDDMERGLPSRVKAVSPSKGAGPVAELLKKLDALVRNTPVRGVDFQEHYADNISEILHSPGGRQLRYLAFSNRGGDDSAGPVLTALINSPLVKTLERLEIDDGLQSDEDALALAQAPFGRLRRMDLPAYHGISCSATAVQRLMNAPWFRKLHQLRTGFSEECCETGMLHLAEMPHLHSLALRNSPARQILALPRAGDFPALRRLSINDVDLTGNHGDAFRQWKATHLIELWLSYSNGTADDLRALAATPLFEKLRVLTLAASGLNEAGLEAVVRSKTAQELRVLRLFCGGGECIGNFQSLARSVLTKSGAFPALTTLRVDYPYAEKAKRDTPVFFRKLATPNVQHLTLKDVDFDDECAEALGSSPTFANLKMLEIGQGYDAKTKLSPTAAVKLFRSPNMQNLIAVKFDRLEIGDALDMLGDPSVMRKLRSGTFWGAKAPSQTIQQLKARRPVVYVG